MDRIPHIIEVALFLLIAFLLGCIIGWAMRRVFSRNAGDKTVPASSSPTPAAGPVTSPKAETEAKPIETKQAPDGDQTAPKSEAGRPQGLDAPREGGADNLKKIKGVGPKIENKLHELGIYHFDQIAAWDQAAIDWVDSYLSFKGRIERDGWIEQAKSFSRS